MTLTIGAMARMVSANAVSSPEIHNWTDAGVASWYDFTVAIQELAGERFSGPENYYPSNPSHRILRACREVIVYEPALSEEEFYHSRVENDLANFKTVSDVICC